MPTRVVNIKLDPFDAYIGRPGRGFTAEQAPFGNPHPVGRPCPRCGNKLAPLDCFREYFLDRLERDRAFRRKVEGLRGKVLGCFCARRGGVTAADRLVCHGQVIAAWLDGLPGKAAAVEVGGNKGPRSLVDDEDARTAQRDRDRLQSLLASANETIAAVQAERDALLAAIRSAGFAVMQCSNGLSIHDVSQKAAEDDQRTAEVIAKNINLEAERDRFKEALAWAVGFIRCNLPKTYDQYPDMRNAASLVADGGIEFGEFQRVAARAEVAEAEVARLKEELDATECSHEDEEAAHTETLRLWNEAKARLEHLSNRLTLGHFRGEWLREADALFERWTTDTNRNTPEYLWSLRCLELLLILKEEFVEAP